MNWFNLIGQLLACDVITLAVFMGLTVVGIRFSRFDIWMGIGLVNLFILVFALRLAYVIESIRPFQP